MCKATKNGCIEWSKETFTVYQLYMHYMYNRKMLPAMKRQHLQATSIDKDSESGDGAPISFHLSPRWERFNSHLGGFRGDYEFMGWLNFSTKF